VAHFHIMCEGHGGVDDKTPHSNGDPTPGFATTSTETIDFSIGFEFAALIYVALEIFREFSVDFINIRRQITVFTRFRLPHHAKCRQNIANSAPHTQSLWECIPSSCGPSERWKSPFI
jgi:hypothetical protein